MESFSFDPWGKRRAPTLADLESILGSWSTLTTYEKGNLTIPSLTLASTITNKGFTGHEQLDPLGLIHMGGRVYDAEIGRFLSADPFVQDTTNLQGLNRYSYVQNNPLSYTDPSGYFLKNLIEKVAGAVKDAFKAIEQFERKLRRKILRAIGQVEGLSTVISIALNFVPGCQAWCSMAFNAAMAEANGGTIGQILAGVAISFVASGIPGNQTGSFWTEGGGLASRVATGLGGGTTGDIGASLMLGGAIAKAQGQKFIDGVKGAGIAIGISLGMDRIVQAAEGKGSPDSRTNSDKDFKRDAGNSEDQPHLNEDILTADLQKLNEEMYKLKPFSSKQKALNWLHENAHPLAVKSGFEVGANIYRDGPSTWVLGDITSQFKVDSWNAFSSGIGRGFTWEASWHSHGGYTSQGWHYFDQRALDYLNRGRLHKVTGHVSYFNGERHVLQ